MLFQNVNENNFQSLKTDLTALIANVLGTSTAFVEIKLKQVLMPKKENGGNIVVNFSKDTTKLQELCFSADFVSRINKGLLDSKKAFKNGVILKSVTIGSSTNARGMLYGYF